MSDRAMAAVVGLAGAAAGFGLGFGLAPRPAASPAGGSGAALTAQDLEPLARAIEQLRSDVEKLEAGAPDGDAMYLAGQRARYRAVMLRQRTVVTAWKAEQPAAKQKQADRALAAIDDWLRTLDAVRDVAGLVTWFERVHGVRQQWPPQHAWLLPELNW